MSNLTSPDRHQAIVGWNTTDRPFPDHLCVHQLIRQQVIVCPDKVAAVHADRSVTYRELDQLSDRIALNLREHGVLPGSLVGLGVERSIEMLGCLLGILKTGAAYLPLDAGLPAHRLSQILEAARPAFIVLDPVTEGCLPASDAQRLSSAALIDELPKANVNPNPNPNPNANAFAASESTSATQTDLPAVDPTQRAYVLFTSGSTGAPKGVEVCHRSVVNLLTDVARDHPGLRAEDVLLAITPLFFDISVLELFAPLVVGATVVIASSETAADANALAQTLQAHDITVMQATPATWQMLVTNHWPGRPTLRALCGGDSLSLRLAQDLVASTACLWNLYGPTETTVWSSAGQFLAGDQQVTIGEPIANTRIYLLDTSLEPVAVGEAAELYIGGAGVALGYLGRADLTAERFVDDPFHPGSRMYRTGDLGRRLPDGRIEHLGRQDNQVKIRGFRIELGDVEHALNSHPMVRESLADAFDVAQDDRRLVAYLIARDGADVPNLAASLRTHLTERLPAYMIPSTLRFVSSYPLTPNGKIDRLALRAAAAAAAASAQAPSQTDADKKAADDAVVDPAAEVDPAMLAIWRDVLSAPAADADDDFFDLGGHSLLAVTLLSRLERRFGVELRPSVLMEASTPRQLMPLLRGGAKRVHSGCLVPIKSSGNRPPLIFVPGLHSALLELRAIAELIDPEQPMYTVDASLLELDASKECSLEDIAGLIVQDIVTMWPQGPCELVGHSIGGRYAYEIARQLRALGRPVTGLILLDSIAPGEPAAVPSPKGLLARLAGVFKGPAATPREPVNPNPPVNAPAIVRASEQYLPGRYDGAVRLVRAGRREGHLSNGDRTSGWGRVIDGPISIKAIDCLPDQMLATDHAAELAVVLNEGFDSVPPRG